MRPNRSQEVQIWPNRFQFVQIGPNGSKWVQMSPNWSKELPIGPNRSRPDQTRPDQTRPEQIRTDQKSFRTFSGHSEFGSGFIGLVKQIFDWDRKTDTQTLWLLDWIDMRHNSVKMKLFRVLTAQQIRALYYVLQALNTEIKYRTFWWINLSISWHHLELKGQKTEDKGAKQNVSILFRIVIVF